MFQLWVQQIYFKYTPKDCFQSTCQKFISYKWAATSQSGFTCSIYSHWHRSVVFIVNFEHISRLVLVFLMLTLNMKLSVGLAPIIKGRSVVKIDTSLLKTYSIHVSAEFFILLILFYGSVSVLLPIANSLDFLYALYRSCIFSHKFISCYSSLFLNEGSFSYHGKNVCTFAKILWKRFWNIDWRQCRQGLLFDFEEALTSFKIKIFD